MTITRGIVLAGGTGTRLHPITLGVSKQLLPVYNKPMIYYPLSVLMLSGIRDILIITTPDDQPQFKRLLGSGAQWGVRFQFTVQERPDGLAQAFVLGRSFLESGPGALVLGDNLFFGHTLPEMLKRAVTRDKGATVFAHHVTDPERYGVVTIDGDGRATAIEEKPRNPASHWAVTGVLLLRRADLRHRRQGQAIRARRTGDHRRQPGLPRNERAARRADGPRICLA